MAKQSITYRRGGASGSGGARPGAGRKPGATSKQKKLLMEIAKQHTQKAIDTMVEVCTEGESESARLTAANMLLDRGYGRPVQGVLHSDATGTGRNIEDATDKFIEIVRRQADALAEEEQEKAAGDESGRH